MHCGPGHLSIVHAQPLWAQASPRLGTCQAVNAQLGASSPALRFIVPGGDAQACPPRCSPADASPQRTLPAQLRCRIACLRQELADPVCSVLVSAYALVPCETPGPSRVVELAQQGDDMDLGNLRPAGTAARSGRVRALLLAASMLCMLPLQLLAQVSNLKAWSREYNATTAPSGSINAGYTMPAGSNRMLVVAVAATRTSTSTMTPGSASWGGQSMTLTISDENTTGTRPHTWIYTLNEAGITSSSGTVPEASLDDTEVQNDEIGTLGRAPRSPDRLGRFNCWTAMGV